MQTNIYLHYNGNCEDALKFYEKAAGAKITAMMRHEGSPAEAQTPKEWLQKILHARLEIGNAAIMASDAPPGRYAKPQGFSVSLSTDTPEEAEKIFKALSEGGAVGMPMAESFFAHKFGMLTDKFDVPWMVLYQKAP
jgi:PhnB protein